MGALKPGLLLAVKEVAACWLPGSGARSGLPDRVAGLAVRCNSHLQPGQDCWAVVTKGGLCLAEPHRGRIDGGGTGKRAGNGPDSRRPVGKDAGGGKSTLTAALPGIGEGDGSL